MAAPSWLRWLIAVAMITVTVYHLSRVVCSGRHRACVRVDVELTHAAMGSAMALMVLNGIAPADLRGLGLVFLAPAVWFAARTAHAIAAASGADVAARQLLGCAVMAYMLLVLASPSVHTATDKVTSAMSGMSMPGVSDSAESASNALSSPDVRAIVVAAVVFGCGWTIARLRSRSSDAGPAFGVGCQLAVNATTIYMLVAM